MDENGRGRLSGSATLRSEEELLGEHADYARNLSLATHFRVGRVGLEVVGDATIHGCEQLKQTIGAAALVQHVTQRLHEPGTVLGVAPRVEAGNGRVGHQEVRLHRDLEQRSGLFVGGLFVGGLFVDQ